MPTPWAVENPSDRIRRPVDARGTALLLLSFHTLGIIYSDIGTSPLYVLNGIWPASGPAPSTEDVIGGVSCIIWSLTLLPLLKYVFIALRFGTNEGEGGTFALFHGLFPPKAEEHEETRALTGESKTSSQNTLSQKLSPYRWVLLIWSLFGTSLSLADGVFTPAVSVTSAVGGIAVSKPDVADSITGISIAFLVGLFVIQRFGTHRLAVTFAPVTFVWLTLLGATGIVNILHHPGIFRAFDPSRAIMLFVRTKQYDILAGVLLAITGCEALFANLGQFNMISIQISFGLFTYPCLLLAYLGQGARLIEDKEAVLNNIFYTTIPGGPGKPLYWIVYVFGILATLIASQAMITATFSLVQQLINMRSLPPFILKYTSETIQGQVYIPAANWALAIATIVVVAAFKNLSALTNAYGFAVSTVMFVTTTLIAVQIAFVKRAPWIFAVAFLAFFGFLDGLFWGASLRKVPQGAWVPLMIGGALLILMVFWTWAKGLENAFDGANRKNLRHIIGADRDAVHTSGTITPNFNEKESYGGPSVPTNDIPDDVSLYLLSDPQQERRKLARIDTCAIFHKLTAGKGVPHSFIGFLQQWPALPRVIVFLSVRIMPVARIAPEDRYRVTKVQSLEGFYGVTYCLGFREDFEVKVDQVIAHVCNLEIRMDPRASRETVNEIKSAARHSTHIVPHYHVISKPVSFGFLTPVASWIRSTLIEDFYRRLATMFPETANWLGSADEIIHVGVTAQI